MEELPRLPLCPAAAPVTGVRPDCGGVVCRIIEQDRRATSGVGMTAGQLQVARGERGDIGAGAFLTLTGDPSTVERLCCGEELPVLDAREVPGNRAHYTYCPTWQARRWADEHGQRQLGRPLDDEPEEVSHYDDGRGGVRAAPVGSSYDSPDPWAKARRDLDELAPPAGSVFDGG